MDCGGFDENCWRCGSKESKLGKEEVANRGMGRLKSRLWRGCCVAEVGWKTGSLEVRG